MKLVQKFSKEIIVFLLISLVYFALRIPSLTIQPIFADEAIYIRWAQVMRAEPTLRFLPLSDGKTPLFMWTMIPLFKIFEDPLYAGRFLSVFSGYMTLLGALFLGWRFIGRKIGLWAAFLIAITPYIVFFDRMALVDSMSAALSIWALNLSLLLLQNPRIDLAMLLGYVFGAGLLNKPPAFFNILVLPSTLLAFKWTDKLRQRKFLKLFGLWVIAIGLAFGIYNILRLGPGFGNLNVRNQDYVFAPTELIGRPLDPFIPHFNDISDWFPKLLTVPILILVVLGMGLALLGALNYFLKRKNGLIFPVIILLWGLVPMMIQMGLLRVFTARYILFSIPPLIVLGALGLNFLIETLKNKVNFPNKNLMITSLAVLTLIPQSMMFNFNLLTDPAKADLPRNERRGYLEDWTAGNGLQEIAQYLDEKSKSGLVVVGTEGSFGTLPDGLQIYLDKNRQVVVVGGGANVSSQIRDAAIDHQAYFVTNKSRYPSPEENLELIKEFPKAKSLTKPQDAMLLYKVSPLNQSSASIQIKKP